MYILVRGAVETIMYSVDGDKSSVQDMVVRQKIANLPSKLYNVDLLSTLKSRCVICTTPIS